jgi:poly-gamma-glutamate synthesis protein (capsule biosynthesis protein)
VNVGLDDFIFNLEHPLSCEGTPARNKVNFCTERSYIKETFGKMPVAVNLANNHIADFGDEAYLRTLEFLKENDIAYFGSGNELDNFNNPAIIQFDGKRMALLGYSCPSTNAIFGDNEHYGSAKLKPVKVIEDIRSSKERADFVVVNLHWGLEDIRYPKLEDVKLARKFIDSGADLIIGHHAHVIQSFEKYKGKYIFYGLGHFIFPYKERPSYFDGFKFQKTHSPKAIRSNKEGLVVNLDSKDSINKFTIFFTGKEVVNKRTRVPIIIPKTYTQFEILKRIQKKRKMLEMFFQNPRIPSLAQIKQFVKG